MDTGTWLQGNLHTHTTASDGSCDANTVIEDYEARGYGFLAISDHDVFVDPADLRDQTNMVLLPAVEVSDNGPHVLHVDATETISPTEDRQVVLDGIRDQGGMAIMAHPKWTDEYAYWPHDALTSLEGYAGIEIYNGVIERHSGAALATDRWDRLLSAGQWVWGYANDDSHQPRDIAAGWNVVQVDERTPEAVCNALATGRFYASTGVKIREIQTRDEEIAIETSNAERIRLVSDYGVVQQTVHSPDVTFRVPAQLVHSSDHTYVRIECSGPAGAMAWTQPMFLERTQ